jgi:hypothetical protein
MKNGEIVELMEKGQKLQNKSVLLEKGENRGQVCKTGGVNLSFLIRLSDCYICTRALFDLLTLNS